MEPMMRTPSGGRAPQKRPVEQRATRPTPEPARSQPAPATPPPRSPRSSRGWLIGGIIAAVLLLAALAFLFVPRTSEVSAIDSDKYQAVFFTNGQVYFGKLENLDSNYMRLSDVYYLRSEQAAGEAGDSANPQDAAASNSNLGLVKLGEEIHGPEDEMIITREQMLFFENLKPDSRVVSLIRSSK